MQDLPYIRMAHRTILRQTNNSQHITFWAKKYSNVAIETRRVYYNFFDVFSHERQSKTDRTKHCIWNMPGIVIYDNNIHRNKNKINNWIQLLMRKVGKWNISTDVQPRFAYSFSFSFLASISNISVLPARKPWLVWSFSKVW